MSSEHVWKPEGRQGGFKRRQGSLIVQEAFASLFEEEDLYSSSEMTVSRLCWHREDRQRLASEERHDERELTRRGRRCSWLAEERSVLE